MTLSAAHRPLNPPFRRAPVSNVRRDEVGEGIRRGVFGTFCGQKVQSTPQGKTVILPFAAGIRKRSRSAKINGPTVARNVFFCYLCLDDSPACGLFALLHVKTATFKCRGEGARMLRELSAHGPATRGSDLLIIETARYGRRFLVSVFGMGCCRPSREYGYLGACAFLFRKRRPGHTDRRLNVASLLFDSSWSM